MNICFRFHVQDFSKFQVGPKSTFCWTLLDWPFKPCSFACLVSCAQFQKFCNSKYKSSLINFDITFVAMIRINGTWFLNRQVLLKVCSCYWPMGH
jgi:hypothetical protein